MTKTRKERPTGSEYDTKVGLAVNELGLVFEGYRATSVELVGMSIRGPQLGGGEFLAVIRGLDEEGGPVVAFHSALDLGELLRGVHVRMKNGTFSWREDEFTT